MENPMRRILIGVAISTCLANIASAEILKFSFVDEKNDQTRQSGADLLSISVVFDNLTGAYTTTLQSTVEAPFKGKIGVNANLANVDTPAYVSWQSYFFDNLRTIQLTEPTNIVSWQGTASSLKYWQAGDRVVTSSDLFGIVSDKPIHSFGSNFTSHLDFPYTSTDEMPRLVIATIAAVPEPSTYALMSIGVASLISLRRHKRA